MASDADTLLKPYREKRDFSRTREPAGGAASGSGLAFVVQKHDATRLHYDFRIEWEGVLKSWAVTKGPSLNPADKRLAVRTEDHPMNYGDFEGTIPKGQYGGGTVMLWDRGTWEPQGDADEGLARGNLKMLIKGEKMTGHWALIRMKPRPGEKHENWLLIKERDEVASATRNLLRQDRSIKTGRTMAMIAKGDEVWMPATERPAGSPPPRPAAKKPAAKPRAQKRARKAPETEAALPAFRPVQLATLVDAAPSGDEWLHEMKYDGYRVLIAIGGGEVRLYTRNALDWTGRFGQLVPAVRTLNCRSALVDGEVVAFDANGRTDFSSLQDALSEGRPLSCFCFDLLELDGTDLTRRPLIKRKEKLEALIAASEGTPLLYSQHVRGSGTSVFKSVCKSGHEGIVSKRADATYSGTRNRSWLKTKCILRQEFVIGGYSPSDKKSRPLASILLGVFEDGKFVYRGRVGSGFNGTSLADLGQRLKAIGRKTSPFAAIPPLIKRGARFVEPQLVAEIEFAELTSEEVIRHGVFKGLREDKEAAIVTDETPAGTKTRPAARKRQAKPGTAAAPAETRRSKGDGDPVQVAGVRLTSPDRVVFESQGLTKKDLADYYAAAAERMLVHAGNRPLSLVRCPQGRQKHCFFQKHDTGGFPDAMGHVDVTEKDGEEAVYLTVKNAAGLVSAVQMGTLEFHIWGSRNDSLEKPDRLVFDLDPDEELTFADVKRAGFDLRDRLGQAGLTTLPMVTGGKGLHLVAPLSRRQGWDEVKAFAASVARRLAADEPERFIATMSKAKRKGRIFVDWLRNERGQTAIAPYSTRSRQGAPVATPVTWDELSRLEGANLFRPADILERLEQADAWADYGKVRQSITKAMQRAFQS